MSLASAVSSVASSVPPAAPIVTRAASEPGYQVIRRNGAVTPFDSGKIAVALTKAFLAVEGNTAAASRRVHEAVAALTEQVTAALTRRVGEGRTFHIEDIQDQAELALMRSEHHKVARAYVLYREERAKAREAEKPAALPAAPAMRLKTASGRDIALDLNRVAASVKSACDGLEGVDPDTVMAEVKRNIYDGISTDELALAKIMAARVLIEAEPNYAFVSARLLLAKLSDEAGGFILGEAATGQSLEG